MLNENPDTFQPINLMTDETLRSPINTSFSKLLVQTDPAQPNRYVVNFTTVCDDSHLKGIQE